MIANGSKAPAARDERPPTQPPPAALVFGGLMVPIGAGVAGLFALLVLAAGLEGDEHAAAVFAAIALLGAISSVAGVMLVAFGSIWWDVRLVRHHVHQKLPKLLVRGLIAWAGAIIVGIAVSAGLGHIPNVGYAFITASFALWFAGAVFLVVGSYRMRHVSRSDHG